MNLLAGLSSHIHLSGLAACEWQLGFGTQCRWKVMLAFLIITVPRIFWKQTIEIGRYIFHRQRPCPTMNVKQDMIDVKMDRCSIDVWVLRCRIHVLLVVTIQWIMNHLIVVTFHWCVFYGVCNLLPTSVSAYVMWKNDCKAFFYLEVQAML